MHWRFFLLLFYFWNLLDSRPVVQVEKGLEIVSIWAWSAPMKTGPVYSMADCVLKSFINMDLSLEIHFSQLV